MRLFRDIPIKRKLTLVMMLTSSAALLLACAAFLAYDLVAFRSQMVSSLSTQAEIIGANSTAALAFQDWTAANETLNALRAERNIVAACLYTRNGKLLAHYLRPGSAETFEPPSPEGAGHRFRDGHLELFLPIQLSGGRIGTIYLRSDLLDLHTRWKRYVGIAFAVMLASSLLAWLLSARLRHVVSEPILGLARVARVVTEKKDYSIRAAKQSQDEAGLLIDAFNEMLSQIQERDIALRRANEDLEQRVHRRTQQLQQELAERRRAEEQLEKSISLLQATIESTTDGLLVVDRQGKVVSFNRKFAQMWRIPDPILESRDDNQLIRFVCDQLRETDSFLAKIRELYDHRDSESHDLIEFNDGRVFERYSQPQRMGGQIVGRVWSFRDITERKRAEEALRHSEEKLRQSQKMEAVGRLAGGIAHDFNNILTVINGYADILIRRRSELDPDRRYMEEILQGGERAAALTHQLLAFSRKQVWQPKVIDLNHVIARLEKMLRRLIGEDIDLRTSFDPQLGSVKTDPGQIEQVILNLAVNARDAMPQGGTLTIRTTQLDLHDEREVGQRGLEPGRFAMLTVIDTGVGMTEQVKSHLFEPFFTTKGLGKGTGLGLATCYGIVQQSGGNIQVQSKPDQGATFTIYLPCVREHSLSPCPTDHTPSVLPRGCETLLVVEDEPGVRTLTVSVLRECGYSVFEFGNGQEGFQFVQSHPGQEIDLVLTDVIMPLMSGTDLMRHVQQLRPGVRFLFTSGYTDDALAGRGISESGVAFLEKPFSSAQLAHKVREVLNQHESPPLATQPV